LTQRKTTIAQNLDILRNCDCREFPEKPFDGIALKVHQEVPDDFEEATLIGHR
jgi:hypothetical protein